MRIYASLGMTLAVTALVAVPAAAETLLVAPTPSISSRAVHADLVVLGKVVEIEKDTINAPAYVGAPKEEKVTYKIAVLKIDEPLIGARGLTQLRVGFLADAPATVPPVGGGPGGLGGRVVRRGPGIGAVALTAGMEGCFVLDPMPGSDFYIISGNGPPLTKKDANFEKEMKAVHAVVKAIDDPVAALKAKELDDRFRAAQAILLRNQRARGNPGQVSREAIPAEENKLLLGVLAELAWLPKEAPRAAGDVAPSRSAIWHTINWNEHGFKQPKNAPGADYNRLMEEATTAFLKENAEKIKLKRVVAGQ